MATTEVQEELEQITVSGVPAELVKRIEQLAGKQRRNRSNMITLLLEESVARQGEEQAA